MPDNDFELGGAAGETLAATATASTGDRSGGPAPHGTEREFTVKARSQRSIIMRRFFQHRAAVIALGVFAAVVLFAFIGGAVWHYQYNVPTPDIISPPSAAHPFGTDSQGFDELALIFRGTQRSLEIALTTATLSTALGTLVGAVAGYYRGIVDTLLMRLVDLVLTIPVLVLGIVLADKYPNTAATWWGLSLVLTAVFWAGSSRVVRGQVLSLREKEFVEAARALGASDRRIIFRHILPNVAGPIIVILTLTVAGTILTETALSFLGFGVKYPDTSLGLMITGAEQDLQAGWPWLFYFPGIFIVLIALTVNFIGDGMRDAFDPTQTRVRA